MQFSITEAIDQWISFPINCIISSSTPYLNLNFSYIYLVSRIESTP